MALGRVNLSRAPHCPAAFSLGNEVMETRGWISLSCAARRTISLLPFFSGLPSFLPARPPRRSRSAGSLPLAFLHPFFLSACHRPRRHSRVCRNRIRFAVSSTSRVYSAREPGPARRAYGNPYFQNRRAGCIIPRTPSTRIFATIARRSVGRYFEENSRLRAIGSRRSRVVES